MRFAIGDPPYLGCGQRLYGHLHPEAGKWDLLESHVELLGVLDREYPDGWAFCLHERSLRQLLPHAAADARVGAWCKPFCRWNPNTVPPYTWEPVIFRTTRWKGKRADRETPRDHLVANINQDQATPGTKPRAFWYWLFDLWCAEPGDELVDLFPGSGGATVAWHEYLNTTRPGVVDTIAMFGDAEAAEVTQ